MTHTAGCRWQFEAGLSYRDIGILASAVFEISRRNYGVYTSFEFAAHAAAELSSETAKKRRFLLATAQAHRQQLASPMSNRCNSGL